MVGIVPGRRPDIRQPLVMWLPLECRLRRLKCARHRPKSHVYSHVSALWQVGAIAASEHGALSRDALVKVLGKERAEGVLRSLLENNRLALRQLSNMAQDIPEAVFELQGMNEVTLYVLPTVAHLRQARTCFPSRPPACLCARGRGSEEILRT